MVLPYLVDKTISLSTRNPTVVVGKRDEILKDWKAVVCYWSSSKTDCDTDAPVILRVTRLLTFITEVVRVRVERTAPVSFITCCLIFICWPHFLICFVLWQEHWLPGLDFRGPRVRVTYQESRLFEVDGGCIWIFWTWSRARNLKGTEIINAELSFVFEKLLDEQEGRYLRW
jgi:hypothetical protein